MPRTRPRKQSLPISWKRNGYEHRYPGVSTSRRTTTTDAKRHSISPQQKLADHLLAYLRNQYGQKRLVWHFTPSRNTDGSQKIFVQCSSQILELSFYLRIHRKPKLGWSQFLQKTGNY